MLCQILYDKTEDGGKQSALSPDKFLSFFLSTQTFRFPGIWKNLLENLDMNNPHISTI